MKEICDLFCGPVKLRPIEKRDLELIRSLLNDPEIASSVVNYGFPVSFEAQCDWFENIYPKENVYRYVIEAEGCSVGTILFAKIDEENQTGEIGYKISREHQRKGYAYSAVCALTRYLFEVKNTECIIVYHFETNTGSKRVMEKAHFLFEGVHRSAAYKNGRRNDIVLWSCPRFHYEKIRKGLCF